MPANEHRGEVEIHLDTNQRVLRFKTKSLALLRKPLGMSHT